MIREVFAEGASPVHRLSRRTRIVVALCFSIVVAVSQSFPVLYAALVFSIALVVSARLSFVEVLKRLSGLFLFLALIWVLLPLSFNGELLLSRGVYNPSSEGILTAFRISLKSISILLAFMSLIATMTAADLGRSLNRLGVPDKLVFLFIMTYRYIFVLESEYTRLRRSLKVRGFHPGLNLHTLKTYAYLAGMLFVRASVRAERVHQAMKCRGFSGQFHGLTVLDGNGKNRLFAGITAIFILSLVIMERFFA